MIQNVQTILNFNKTKKNLNFLKTQPQPRSQTFPISTLLTPKNIKKKKKTKTPNTNTVAILLE
jgi:hypothetical protein